jgi:outer membrane lipoprotein SlyB
MPLVLYEKRESIPVRKQREKTSYSKIAVTATMATATISNSNYSNSNYSNSNYSNSTSRAPQVHDLTYGTVKTNRTQRQ